MDEYERRSYNMQLDLYHGNRNDLRSYSINNNNSWSAQQNDHHLSYGGHEFPYDFDKKLRRTKTTPAGSSSSSKIWCFNDPEIKRKKRVASYRAFTVEGKVKGTFRKSFKWIKDKVLYAWW